MPVGLQIFASVSCFFVAIFGWWAQRAAVERPVLLREGSRWRALRLLAKSADGHTEPYLFARGISKALLAGLLRDGLATWSKARAGIERPIDIVRVKITVGTASARMIPALRVDSRPWLVQRPSDVGSAMGASMGSRKQL